MKWKQYEAIDIDQYMLCELWAYTYIVPAAKEKQTTHRIVRLNRIRKCMRNCEGIHSYRRTGRTTRAVVCVCVRRLHVANRNISLNARAANFVQGQTHNVHASHAMNQARRSNRTAKRTKHRSFICINMLHSQPTIFQTKFFKV